MVVATIQVLKPRTVAAFDRDDFPPMLRPWTYLRFNGRQPLSQLEATVTSPAKVQYLVDLMRFHHFDPAAMLVSRSQSRLLSSSREIYYGRPSYHACLDCKPLDFNDQSVHAIALNDPGRLLLSVRLMHTGLV